MEEKKMYLAVDQQPASMEGLKVQRTGWRGKLETVGLQVHQAKMGVAD